MAKTFRVAGSLLCLVLSSIAAQAQSVQLPTYSFTSVATTVSVPDRGSAFLGGITRSEEGRSEFGVPMLKFPPFKNQAIGQSRSASSMRVTATIHDFDAMDEALLGSSAANFTSSAFSAPGLPRRFEETPAAMAGRTLQPRNPALLAGKWAVNPDKVEAASLAGTVADQQARRSAQQQTRADEAASFLDRARQAEADGKPNVARIYYQMVVRRSTGDAKREALARLEAIVGAKEAGRIVQSAAGQ